jgi:polysaccharide biosynthesis/export protein
VISRRPPAWLFTTALLISYAQSGVAQSGMRQAAGSSNGTSSSAPSASGGMSSAGLTTVPADFAKLKLAPGFLVILNVLDDPDMAGAFRIDQQGDISVPILGTIHLAGETVPEARVEIQDRLRGDQILKDPQVSLAVQEYIPPEVTILGEVGSPGKYPLLVTRNLVDVLAIAGGPAITAGNEVQITRGGAGGGIVLIHYSRSTNPQAVEDALVYPGDIVQVGRAGIVYVLGEVNRPGGFVMQEEGTLNVLQAMSLAGGTTKLASTGAICLLRRNADGVVVCSKVPYAKICHGKSADFQLDARDVLYVPTSKIKLLYVDTQSVMNSAATAGIYSATVN